MKKLSKHKGFGLIMGLVIASFGLLVVASMFSSVYSFASIFSGYRGAYSDAILASSYVERIKGYITETNERSLEVLHSPKRSHSGDTVEAIGDLLIEGGDQSRLHMDEIVVMNGWKRIETRVYDATYKAEFIRASFPDAEFKELPPSFRFNTTETGAMDNGGKNGSYEDPFAEAEEGGLDPEELYKKCGAYLIRVRIFNLTEGETGGGKLVRTTEEAFIQVKEI